ncbi:hypothetical protein BS50DRAFT_16486 [Corynespora cassiicola Philippines]|uniref:Uncharacterized protein n=1 Tax=Corynespora cassiicola Philippines TaxID=1448308 RepID=A0A2T2P9W7_CORCC|nr:hypothetical protein BS50DRAFT_16486 [Corynespora cassiicola Philippines]
MRLPQTDRPLHRAVQISLAASSRQGPRFLAIGCNVPAMQAAYYQPARQVAVASSRGASASLGRDMGVREKNWREVGVEAQASGSNPSPPDFHGHGCPPSLSLFLCLSVLDAFPLLPSRRVFWETPSPIQFMLPPLRHQANVSKPSKMRGRCRLRRYNQSDFLSVH